MIRERLFLFDTTLRDGQQTQGVQFSSDEKTQITKALDDLGLDPSRIPARAPIDVQDALNIGLDPSTGID